MVFRWIISICLWYNCMYYVVCDVGEAAHSSHSVGLVFWGVRSSDVEYYCWVSMANKPISICSIMLVFANTGMFIMAMAIHFNCRFSFLKYVILFQQLLTSCDVYTPWTFF